MARGFKIADAYVEVTVDKDALKDSAKGISSAAGPELDRSGKDMGKRLGKSLGDESDRQGRDAGGKLAVGMRMSLIRNSPLIVAAVAGALAVGAPAMLAAATGLFAGIGILAAAQSAKVQSAWLGTWNHVKAGAIQSASAIEPVLVRMAAQVAKAFDQMRPSLTAAFTAAAPQIAVFTRGIIDLAQNAMPGLVRAVEGGMPVTRGFADFLAKVGTGLSDFFDRLTAHAPAAGAAFSSLGDSFAALLPTLGELLGQGAELASVLLPMLSGSLGLVLKVVSALGPALPAVVAGLTAMKITGAVSGLFDTFGGKLKSVGSYLGVVASASGTANASMATMRGAAGPLAAAVGIAGAAFMAAQQQINDWARALLAGGTAAAQARTQMGDVDSFLTEGATGWYSQIFGIKGYADALGVGSNASKKAQEAADKLLAAMDPVGRSSALLTQATNDLSAALEGEGKYAGDIPGAHRAYDAALAASETANSDLEQAIHGVTQAMIDQANQAMGSINADFAYQDSLDALEGKQKDLAVAIRDHGKASEEASDAQRALAEGIWDTAQKAAAASPVLDGLEQGTAEYDRAVQNLTLKSLVEMRKGLGPEMGAVVDGMIAKMQAGGASLDELGKKKPKPTVDANIAPLQGKTQTSFNLLDILGGKRPTPVANLNAGPFSGMAAWVHRAVDAINARRANPQVTLHANTRDAEYYLNLAARNRTSTVYMKTVMTAERATGGPVDVHPVIKAAAGRIVGPGGPTDDMVPAVGPGGSRWALSNGEWVIKAASSSKYGPAAMAAINAGTANVSVPQRGMASGGETRSGAGVSVQNLNVHVSGTWDFSSPRAARAVAEKVRDALVNLERESR